MARCHACIVDCFCLPAALLRTVQGVGVVGNGGGKAVAKKANSNESKKEARKTAYEVVHPLRFKPSSARKNKQGRINGGVQWKKQRID